MRGSGDSGRPCSAWDRPPSGGPFRPAGALLNELAIGNHGRLSPYREHSHGRSTRAASTASAIATITPISPECAGLGLGVDRPTISS